MLCTWCTACTFLSLGLLVAELLSFESLLKRYLLRETLLTTQCMKLSSIILYYITLFYFLQSMCHSAIILFIYYFFIMCLFTAHPPLNTSYRRTGKGPCLLLVTCQWILRAWEVLDASWWLNIYLMHAFPLYNLYRQKY